MRVALRAHGASMGGTRRRGGRGGLPAVSERHRGRHDARRAIRHALDRRKRDRDRRGSRTRRCRRTLGRRAPRGQSTPPVGRTNQSDGGSNETTKDGNQSTFALRGPCGRLRRTETLRIRSRKERARTVDNGQGHGRAVEFQKTLARVARDGCVERALQKCCTSPAPVRSRRPASASAGPKVEALRRWHCSQDRVGAFSTLGRRCPARRAAPPIPTNCTCSKFQRRGRAVVPEC
mmetsp:Transcript_6724/g.41076  ORF Transcript_6724/g.41076 Transcript_6724/m.41076 type:complete len:234 (+) Transcript_6724:5502-6203(+)